MTNANLKCIVRVSTKNYAKYVISLHSRKLRDLFEEITASRLSRTFFKNTTHSFFTYLHTYLLTYLVSIVERKLARDIL